MTPDTTSPKQRPQGGVRAPETVVEGGVLEIDVSSGVKSVSLVIPGHGRFTVPVVDGVAEWRLPPSIPGGATIFISDRKLPSPSAATVEVVSNQ
ncbi:MAG: hypothetical protein AB7I19_18965 [Planctomycetota bacterium]